MAVAAEIDRIVGDRYSSGATPHPGHGALDVRRSGSKSVVTRARATSPLKLLTPGNNGSAAWVFTSTYGGGLVDGDYLDLSVDVGAGAALMCSTQASTKVYRSPHGTRADLRASVAGTALLASLPDPVVCFADSRYTQRQTFDLASGASLVHLDWLSCGRQARGERWAFTSYRSSLRVRLDGRLICYDALALAQDDGAVAERLDRFEVIATIVLLGSTCQARVQELLTDSAVHRPGRRLDALQSVAPIGNGAGCLIRLADVSLEHTGRTIRQLLDFLPERLGDDPWARKW